MSPELGQTGWPSEATLHLPDLVGRLGMLTIPRKVGLVNIKAKQGTKSILIHRLLAI
jgi:hypothetical protein